MIVPEWVLFRHAQSSTPATRTATPAPFFRRSLGVVLQAGQNRRVADRHPKPSHQPLRGPPARAMAEQPNDFRKAGGPARERRRETRPALGEDALITLQVATPPTPEAGSNNDWRSLSGQIPKRS